MKSTKFLKMSVLSARGMLVLLAGLLFWACATPSMAQQPGDLDPTFGNGGIVTTIIGDDSYLVDVVENLAIQPDGKILAVGSSRDAGQKRFTLVRYNVDGSLDATFGNGGIVVLNPNSYYGNFVMAAEILPDGKILACARIYDPNATNNATSRPVLIRLHSNGDLDTTFGAGGYVVCEFGNHNVFAENMVRQDDGKIIVVGYYDDNMLAIRFDANGSVDISYGVGGFCVVEIPYSSYVNDVALQADGKLVIVGQYYGDYAPKWAIARINQDGTLDQTFAENGIKQVSLGYGNDFATAVAIQDDGKIIVGGHTWIANDPVLMYDFAVIRLLPDGSFDPTFANNGIFTHQLERDGQNYINKIVISPVTGNIYAAFTVVYEPDERYNMGVFGMNPNGTLLENFANNGYSSLNANGGTNNAMTLVRQADGKLILGAEAFFGNSTGVPFTLVRFLTGEDAAEPCDAPVLTAEAADYDGKLAIRCSWNAIDGATQYTLYQDGEQLATTTETEMYITDIEIGQTYCFTVTTTCAAGVSEPSNEACHEVMSINENNAKTVLSIYPNPAKEQLNIRYDGSHFTVQIFEIGSGRLVITEQDSHSINIANLPAGYYLVKLVSEKEVVVGRVVKM